MMCLHTRRASSGRPDKRRSPWASLQDSKIGLPNAPPPVTPEPPEQKIDYLADAYAEFPEVYSECATATEDVVDLLQGGDYRRLSEHGPGLRDFSWEDYLRLSLLRVVRAPRAVKTFAEGQPAEDAGPIRVLDFGANFGNFALTAGIWGFASMPWTVSSDTRQLWTGIAISCVPEGLRS